MKQISMAAALMIQLASTGPMAVAQNSPAPSSEETQKRQRDAEQVVTGKIALTDDGRYILVDTAGVPYRLDDQNAAKKFLGKKVRVSGTLDTSEKTIAIHVTEIKAIF